MNLSKERRVHANHTQFCVCTAMSKSAAQKHEWPIILVAFLFMFFFGRIIGPFSVVTQVGANILGVFIGVILLTVFTSQSTLAAILGIIAVVYSGFLTSSAAISSWMGGATVPQLIFVSALCVALKDAGVIDVLVRKLLSFKALRGRPVLLLFSLFFSSFIVSMFIGFIPTALLYFGIYESIRDVCGYDKCDRFCKFVLLGIYLGCMGNFCFPFKGIALTIYTLINTSMQGFGLNINMFTYMFVCILVNFVWLSILSFMIPGIFKCNIAPLKDLEIENVEALRSIPKKFNKRQKIILAVFCLSFLYIIVVPLLPQDFPGNSILSPIGTTLIFLLALAVLGLIQVDGKPLANPMKLLSEGTLWNVVCIVGCFTFLGNAMASADLGIRDWIIMLLKPVFGNMPLPLLLLLLTIVITIITNICNGTPLTLLGNAAIMPFVCQMQLDTGISASVTAATLSLCANMAFLTYAGTIYAALLLDREEIDNRFIWHDAIKVIPVYIVVVYIIALGCSYILP